MVALFVVVLRLVVQNSITRSVSDPHACVEITISADADAVVVLRLLLLRYR